MNKSVDCRIYTVKSANIISIQKEKTKRKKSNQTITLLAGGDEDDKSETVLSSDNARLLALSLKLK